MREKITPPSGQSVQRGRAMHRRRHLADEMQRCCRLLFSNLFPGGRDTDAFSIISREAVVVTFRLLGASGSGGSGAGGGGGGGGERFRILDFCSLNDAAKRGAPRGVAQRCALALRRWKIIRASDLRRSVALLLRSSQAGRAGGLAGGLVRRVGGLVARSNGSRVAVGRSGDPAAGGALVVRRTVAGADVEPSPPPPPPSSLPRGENTVNIFALHCSAAAADRIRGSDPRSSVTAMGVWRVR